MAWIDEERCIGCTLCIQACPVDAIVGAAKRMHTVIAAHCTGCDLCLPPCPVDCIEMRPAGNAAGPSDEAADARRQARLARLARRPLPSPDSGSRRRRAVIEAALARARAKRAARTRA